MSCEIILLFLFFLPFSISSFEVDYEQNNNVFCSLCYLIIWTSLNCGFLSLFIVIYECMFDL